MAIDRRNSFAAIPQLDAKLEKILNDNVIFEKKIINIQEFQSDFYSEYGQYKELTVGRFDAVTADIAYLKTFEADIENLEADNATINGKLTAQEASIGSLEADNATINGKLTAQEASIENLEADNATINGKLTAQEAEITNLSGEFASFVSGEFGTLSADVADIQTLMFGSATGTTITSEFANTVVSHIGEAQIDSAMIKDLTFDKITGFDVNTTNLTIHSEDGKSQWHDNTIQISDANRVRVQIGKDASNDYSMYVWDAEGNLMFDALGLTASGIQREIIRNDMVAEDAAINGSKLDIESVFREMDGSTYTLTSNHLTYDGKSLDLTLQSMSETDKEQGQLLSSQGTQITAIQGQIASKIWQQDIDTATGEMNTKYSELEQELGGFKTTVGETYSTKAEAEVLAEAANNAQKTAENAQTDLNNAKANLANVTSRVDATEEDIAAAQKAVDDAQTAANNAQKAAVAAKSAADQAQSDLNALTKRVETAETSISQNTEQISLRATKSEVTTAKDEALNESKSYTDAQIKVSADGITSSVSKTYATKEALSAAETRITQTENSINSQVSETNGLKERMSTVEQTANGLEVRLSTAESDIDTAQSTADNAAKTATNFLGYDGTNGLLIGNKTSGSWSGYRSQMLPTAFNILDESGNPISSYGTVTTIGKTSGQHVYIDSDSLDIKNGPTVLATFSGDTLKCGSNFSVDKNGKIKSTSGTIGGFTIDADKLSNTDNPTSVLDIGYTQEELKKWPGAMGDSSYIDYQGNMMVGKDNTGVGFYSLRRRGIPPVTISETRSDYKLDLATGEKTDIVSSKLYAGLSGEAAVFVIGTNETMDSWTETWYSHAGFGSQYVEETGLGLTATDATMQAECNLDVTGNITSKGTAVSLEGHTHNRLYNISDSSYKAYVALILDGDYYYFRGSEASKYVCGSEARPWYKTFTERLEVTKDKPVFTYIGSKGGGSTVSYATNMYVGSTGIVSRTTKTSSKTIKHDIAELKGDAIKAENLYNVNVYQAKYNEDILSDDDPRYLKDLPMFIIEDLDEKYPVVIDKPSENVKEWSWNAQYIIPPMLKLIQMQHEEIEAIKAELEEMRAS